MSHHGLQRRVRALMRVGGGELGSRTPSAVVRPPASAWRTAGCTQSMLLSCSDFMSALELVMRRPVCGLWRARSGAFKASKSKGGAKTCRVLNHGLHARMMWSGLHVHVVSIDAAVANFRQQAVRPGHVGSEGIGEHAKGAALRTHQVKKHGWTCDIMRSWPFSRLGQALSGHSRDAVQASLITRLLHPNMQHLGAALRDAVQGGQTLQQASTYSAQNPTHLALLGLKVLLHCGARAGLRKLHKAIALQK